MKLRSNPRGHITSSMGPSILLGLSPVNNIMIYKVKNVAIVAGTEVKWDAHICIDGFNDASLTLFKTQDERI